jgi:hypothetical protein
MFPPHEGSPAPGNNRKENGGFTAANTRQRRSESAIKEDGALVALAGQPRRRETAGAKQEFYAS